MTIDKQVREILYNLNAYCPYCKSYTDKHHLLISKDIDRSFSQIRSLYLAEFEKMLLTFKETFIEVFKKLSAIDAEEIEHEVRMKGLITKEGKIPDNWNSNVGFFNMEEFIDACLTEIKSKMKEN